MSFTPTLQAPGRARRVVEEFTADLDPDSGEKLKLLASELVTNAVKHADAPADHAVTLEVALDGGSVHMSVTDGGNGFERQGFPNVGDFGGWDCGSWTSSPPRGARRTRTATPCGSTSRSVL